MKASHIATLIGILQQAHYDSALFRSWVARHPAPEEWNQWAGKVKPEWSAKARLLRWFAYVCSGGIPRLLPYALPMALRLIKPPEFIGTKWIGMRARRHIRKHRPKLVIGITGSYGKTTTKEMVAHLLSSKYRVHKTPENINTLLGIARWILKNHFTKHDIIVIEMGAYHEGDIAAIVRIAKPDVGILAGLNEAHLERFGSLEITTRTKCELGESLPSGGTLFWNRESPLLREAIRQREARWQKRGIHCVGYNRRGVRDIKISSAREDEEHITAEITRGRILDPRPREDNRGLPPDQVKGKLSTMIGAQAPAQPLSCRLPFLGFHFVEALSAGVAVADLLHMSTEEIMKGCRGFRPATRRFSSFLAPGNKLVVDDSYNITLDGFKAASEALREILRRKIGVFAGIPEGGRKAGELNYELGRQIATVCEVVILRVTPVMKEVMRGLLEAGFPEKNILTYNESVEVEEILKQIVKDGDCIYLSAYDWPAIYL